MTTAASKIGCAGVRTSTFWTAPEMSTSSLIVTTTGTVDGGAPGGYGTLVSPSARGGSKLGAASPLAASTCDAESSPVAASTTVSLASAGPASGRSSARAVAETKIEAAASEAARVAGLIAT